MNSLWVMIPPIASGLLMMLFRPWYGELRHPKDTVSNLQYSVLNVFVIMTIVCIATAWFNYVATRVNRTADIIPIVPLLLTALWRIPMVMSLIWLMFSNRNGFVALVLFLVLSALSFRNYSLASFGYAVYSWSIVVATLGVFRNRGYRLLGSIQCDTATDSLTSPRHGSPG